MTFNFVGALDLIGINVAATNMRKLSVLAKTDKL